MRRVEFVQSGKGRWIQGSVCSFRVRWGKEGSVQSTQRAQGQQAEDQKGIKSSGMI